MRAGPGREPRVPASSSCESIGFGRMLFQSLWVCSAERAVRKEIAKHFILIKPSVIRCRIAPA